MTGPSVGPTGLLIGLDGAGESLSFQGFTIKLGMLHLTGNDQGRSCIMSLHHNIDRLGDRQTGDRLHQALNHVLHRVEVIVVQQHMVARG